MDLMIYKSLKFHQFGVLGYLIAGDRKCKCYPTLLSA